MSSRGAFRGVKFLLLGKYWKNVWNNIQMYISYLLIFRHQMALYGESKYAVKWINWVSPNN
jgi:hypothetical protein